MSDQGHATARDRCPCCGGQFVFPPEGDPVCASCMVAELFGGDEPGTDRDGFRAPGTEGEADRDWIEIPGFDLHECLGRGSMGVVFRATQKAPRREVAIKVLSSPGVVTSKEARRRFAREIELAARLRHPGIVPIYESGLAKSGGIFYYVMELVEGLPLDRWLAAHSPTLDAKLALFEEVCTAVVAAHRQGILHRDLTPANILVTKDSTPRLLDFGLGRILDPSESGSLHQSLHQSILGSPCTMSPEQAAGSRQVDTRSDLYSLGAMLYYMISNEWPHDQEGDLLDVLHRIAAQPARPIHRFAPHLDRGLRAILECALATDPARRYQSVAELSADIARFRRKEELSVRPLTTWQRLGLQCRRQPLHTALWATSLLLVATLAVGGPLLALQQARLREEIEAREATRHRSMVRLLMHADSSSLLEVVQAMEADLPAMTPLLQQRLKEPDCSLADKIRLKAAFYPGNPELESELVHFLENTSDPGEALMLAHVLRHRADRLAERFRVAIDSGELPPRSRTLFNHYAALAQWRPDDTAFWDAHADSLVAAILTQTNRASSHNLLQLAQIFRPVGDSLSTYLQPLAAEDNEPARALLSQMIDPEVRKAIELAIRSDHDFMKTFSRLERDPVQALSGLSGIYKQGVSRFRELPEDSAERERLGRVAAAMVRLDRDCDVWHQLGYRWAMRETLIKMLPRLGVSPETFHWKLRHTNQLNRKAEATRSAIARCLLHFEPDDFSPAVRDNIVKRQREVLDGSVPSIEAEPVESARRLLDAWGYFIGE